MNLSEINTTLLNITAAIIIILVGIIIANILNKLTRKLLKELEINKIFKEKLKIILPIEKIISLNIKYLVYIIAIVLALKQLGIITTMLQIIIIIILTIIIITILLAIKSLIPNIIAGFKINKKIRIGDKIKISNIQGKIIEIKFLETKIQTKNKEIVYMPNSLIIKK